MNIRSPLQTQVLVPQAHIRNLRQSSSGPPRVPAPFPHCGGCGVYVTPLAFKEGVDVQRDEICRVCDRKIPSLFCKCIFSLVPNMGRHADFRSRENILVRFNQTFRLIDMAVVWTNG
ncbi:hypothetical protein TNCV_2500061 [Trichonephila clavipes]|nr:hypothetical protein TNCV_2500061 [Trichonephila clavipes]